MLILKILSYIFLIIVKIRIFLYKTGILKSYKIKGIKIVSVGNISLGGTGKTPVTMELSKNLFKKNFKIAILLRGYKRKNKAPILLVSNGEKIFYTPKECGDEAYLLAKNLNCPVVVAKNRVKGAKYLKDNFNLDFIILDDGFQHLRLQRDIDIVLVTQKTLKEKVYLLPAKKYREPISHLKRASFIIITKIFDKKTLKKDYLKLKKTVNKNIYGSEIILKGFKNQENKNFKKDYFKNKKVVIFCGIEEPVYFEKLLENNGLIIKEKVFFPDHYTLKHTDYKKLNSFSNYPIITTEKDIVKLNFDKLNSKIYVAEISYKFFKIN
jgi:tetraacyldisaccharide 4'-kinase